MYEKDFCPKSLPPISLSPFCSLYYRTPLSAWVTLARSHHTISSKAWRLIQPLDEKKERIMEIYVGNLSYQAQESDVQEAFEQHGTVERVQLIQDRFTGRSKGFGFVSMPDFKEAQAAIKALDGAEICGRSVTVNQARPREERPTGSRGGGGGDSYRSRGRERR